MRQVVIERLVKLLGFRRVERQQHGTQELVDVLKKSIR